MANLHSVRPEFFPGKTDSLSENSVANHFKTVDENVRKNEKNYLTGVSNLQSTCPDDRSEEKNFYKSIYVNGR